MKKMLLLFFATVSLFASNKDDFLKYLKTYFPPNVEITINIIDEMPVSELKNTTAYFFQVEHKGDKSRKELMFVQDKHVFSEMVSMETKEPLSQTYKAKIVVKTIKPLFQKEAPENIISLGNDKNKKTMLIFTDPECPYCRAHMDDIENYLKKYNVKFLLTTTHEKSALEKEYLILRDIKPSMKDEEKIAILRKYYDDNYKVDKAISDKDLFKLIELKERYFTAGVTEVPFFIEL